MKKRSSKAITELDKALKSISNIKRQNKDHVFSAKELQKDSAMQMVLYYLQCKLMGKNNGRK